MRNKKFNDYECSRSTRLRKMKWALTIPNPIKPENLCSRVLFLGYLAVRCRSLVQPLNKTRNNTFHEVTKTSYSCLFGIVFDNNAARLEIRPWNAENRDNYGSMGSNGVQSNPIFASQAESARCLPEAIQYHPIPSNSGLITLACNMW